MATPRRTTKRTTTTTSTRTRVDEAEMRERRMNRTDEMDASLWVAQNTNIVPLLYGPTATGKTYTMRKMAEAMGAHFEVILLSTDTPDEVMGFQTVGEGGVLHAQAPYWFRRTDEYLSANPGGTAILFFDEVGQAPHEVLAAVYTFFRDRTMRGRTLDGNVLVFGATNACTFTAAMRSRLCPIHFPASMDYLKGISNGHALAELVVSGADGLIATTGGDPESDNTAPPAPATLNAAGLAVAVACENASFYRLTVESQSLVLSGVLPPLLAEKALRHLNESASVDIAELCREPDLLRDMIVRLDRPKAVALAVNALHGITQLGTDDEKIEAFSAILDALVTDVEKLKDYYEMEKPESLLTELATINPEKFTSALKASGRLTIANSELTGQWVRDILAQDVTVEE